VKTQVWIAISVYVLVAIVKKELRLERSLYEILQILSVALFEKTPIFEALSCKNCTNESLVVNICPTRQTGAVGGRGEM
jgi:hypothetical protein